eukprot:1777902-Prorocentrum_lima.AAC.1
MCIRDRGTTPPAAEAFGSAAGVLHPPLPATTAMYAEGPTIAVPSFYPPSSRTLDQAENEARMEYVAFLGDSIPKAVSGRSAAAQAAQLGRKLVSHH